MVYVSLCNFHSPCFHYSFTMRISSSGPLQTSRLLTLPPDVLLRLLVHMEFSEVSRLSLVCRTLHSMVPIALYLQIHHEQQNMLKLELRVRGVRTPIPLYATVFDPVHKSIEFRCKPTAASASTVQKQTSLPQLQAGDSYYLQFQPWQVPIVLTDRADDSLFGSDVTAQKLFHERYHPFAETEYRCRKGYVGDERVLARWRSVANITDVPTSHNGRYELVWLRVSLPYILSGKSKSPTLPGPMYPDRVMEFKRALDAANQSDYNSEDQIYLAWLAGDIDSTPESIVSQVSPHPSRRQLVERELSAHNVSPTCLWKYGFARRFIHSNPTSNEGSEWTVASVVKRIIAAEEAPTNPRSIAGIASTTSVNEDSLGDLIRNALGSWWKS
ncbi:hypothetical protein BDF22DRAFT_686122 [Syncephalis plumigaleata]|nr:hypothetical protein BDF22DRAFT_686122 [Syncephalis plumigaleata]